MALISRIRAQLNRKGISAHRASVEAGLGGDYVRKIENGTNKSPSAENLVALAKTLDTTLMYLVGLTDDHSPRVSISGDRRLPIRWRGAAGTWVERDAHAATFSSSEILPSRRYPASAQWAVEVIDTHAEGLGIGAGAMLHCIEWQAMAHELTAGDVILLRRRQGVNLEEVSVRLVVGPPGAFVLETRGRGTLADTARTRHGEGKTRGGPSANAEAALAVADLESENADIIALVVSVLQPVGLIRG